VTPDRPTTNRDGFSDEFPGHSADFSLVLGGPLYQLWRRTRMADDALQLLRRRIVKDLACLDKVAKYRLSRTQRLRFYLQYQQRPRLQQGDRGVIDQVLRYFEGRE